MAQKNMIKRLVTEGLQNVRAYYKLSITLVQEQVTRSVNQNKESGNKPWII